MDKNSSLVTTRQWPAQSPVYVQQEEVVVTDNALKSTMNQTQLCSLLSFLLEKMQLQVVDFDNAVPSFASRKAQKLILSQNGKNVVEH